MKIIKANKSHISQLKKIWKVCFGDTDEYIDFFFDNRFDTCYCIAAQCDGKICGCAYLLPVSANEYGTIKHGFYGYAIGVLPKYRGKELYMTIDSKIEEYINENNLFYILCPANERLNRYYQTLGFTENAFVYKNTMFPSGNDSCAEITRLTPEECLSMRNECFDNMIYWDIDAIKYVFLENSFTGGKNIKLIIDGNEFFLIMRLSHDTLTVIESNITENLRQKATDYLCKTYSADNINWILPAGNNKPVQLYGLSKNLNCKGYYLNFILD